MIYLSFHLGINLKRYVCSTASAKCQMISAKCQLLPTPHLVAPLRSMILSDRGETRTAFAPGTIDHRRPSSSSSSAVGKYIQYMQLVCPLSRWFFLHEKKKAWVGDQSSKSYLFFRSSNSRRCRCWYGICSMVSPFLVLLSRTVGRVKSRRSL
jgi:hypothetical protein